MEGFQVTEIGEKIYCILDAGNSSFYVVEGEEKAAQMVLLCTELKANPKVKISKKANKTPIHGCFNPFFM